MAGRLGIGTLAALTVKVAGAEEVMAVWTAGVGTTVTVGSNAVRASPPLGAGGVGGGGGGMAILTWPKVEASLCSEGTLKMT